MAGVITQTEASRRRQRMPFCYLCGQNLTEKCSTMREHIVPRVVLGVQPSPSAWALVLNVHKTCENRDKRGADALFALWQRLFLPTEERMARATEVIYEVIDGASPANASAQKALALATVTLAAAYGSTPDSHAINAALDQYLDVLVSAGGIPSRDASRAKTYVAALFDPRHQLNLGHYRGTPIKVIEGVPTDESVLPLDGIEDIMGAVWTWVRGLHALVWESFLPTLTPHVVLTPLPVFSGISTPRPFVDERIHQTILATLDSAAQANKLYQVKYWNEQCGYRCVWVHLPEAKAFARCVWGLNVPGPQETGAWWGWYDLPVPPKDAELLDEFDLELYNNRRHGH
jgi:hypothetical protein